jgi:acyl-CoA thioesterase FadM
MTQNSLVYHSKIYSNASGKLVGESEVLMVSFDFKAGKKADLDASTVEAITKLEDDPKLTQKLAKKLPSRNLAAI